jgi:hypothetical protein
MVRFNAHGRVVRTGLAVILALHLAACSSSWAAPEERIELGPVARVLVEEDASLRLQIYPYRVGRGSGRMWIASIQPRGVDLSLQPHASRPVPLSDLVAQVLPQGDFVAINGGFYDRSGPLGLVISSGTTIHPLRRDGGSGVLLVAGGIPRIVHRDAFQAPPDTELALQSIDRLVDRGRNLVRPRNGMPHDARSVVAIDARGVLFFIVVFDDRAIASSKGSYVRLNRRSTDTGVTLFALAEFLARSRKDGGWGATSALNLDGGFSSSFQARPDRGSEIMPPVGTGLEPPRQGEPYLAAGSPR